MPDLAIEFAGTQFAVNEQTIVGPLDLAIRRGEKLVFLGRSGSGKTTSLRLINRLLVPTAGTVRVDGRSTMDWDPVRLRRRIGYVIQEVGLLPHLTVEANVGLIPRLEGWPAERIRARVNELLALVGLTADQLADRLPHRLSGGQRQRVGLARALAADPPLLLCDEPFGSLDAATRADLQREFAGLIARLEKTVVFVTHDVREALMLASRIAVFRDGRIAFLGTVEEFAATRDESVRTLRDIA